MKLVRRINELRTELGAARRAGRRIGFVPTMGAFHEGHRSLMRLARARSDVVVVSLFVNPTQFNEAADLAAYPRDEAADAEIARGEGVDVLFAPDAPEMYPPGFATTVRVTGVSEPLEGAFRGPRHFEGVATVVSKLLNIVQPDVAWFGQKDAQQALVVRRMVRDLDLPVRIEIAPTVREADGLAMSSRNARLDPESRRRALALRRGLDAALQAVSGGTRDADEIVRQGTAVMRDMGVEPEYFAVVSAESLEPVRGPAPSGSELLIAVAAHVGPVRLIDNEVITVP